MDELISALMCALEQADLPAVRAIPDGVAPRLTGAVIAVGLSGAKATECGLYAYLGMAQVQGELRAVYGKQLEAELFLEVRCPRRLGSALCIRTAQAAADVLSTHPAGIRILSFTAKGCVYDEKSDCFLCRLTADARAYLYAVANEQETEFTDFILKGATGIL